MRLLGSTKKDVDQDKDEEDVPKLGSVEVVLVRCNLVNSNYQQASKVLFTFVANKLFGHLITIAPHSLTMLNTANTEFSSIEVWFTDLWLYGYMVIWIIWLYGSTEIWFTEDNK